MLVVDSVSKSYGSNRILDGVSFSVEMGKIVGLLGLNGAGKSTLLKGLSTVSTFDSGEISLEGVKLHEKPISYRSLVGYQPEIPSLQGAMTVKEHLRFYGKLRGLKGSDLQNRVEELLGELSLLHIQNSPCRELSQGESQRTSFAIATIHHPALLLLDEPTRGLDPQQLAFFRGTLKNEKSSRITLLSTHHLHEAEMLCDVIVILSNGTVEVIDRELIDTLPEKLEKYFIRQVRSAG